MKNLLPVKRILGMYSIGVKTVLFLSQQSNVCEDK